MEKLQRLCLLMITAMVVSCGGDDGPTVPDVPEPTTGALEVTTNTTGSDIDSDGYTVTAGTKSTGITSSGSAFIFDLSEGSYDVELSEAASNCSVSNSNPRSVSITAGDTTSTIFDVSCKAQLKNEILFQSDRDTDPFTFELFVMNEDGSNVRQLTSSGDSIPWDISSDGTKILYFVFDSGNRSLYQMNADGSEQEELISNAVVGSWSPDESQIVFSSDRDGDYELYIADADGSNIQQITDNSYGDYSPVWSPTNDSIVFRSSPGDDSDLYSIDADGTGLTQLTSASRNVGNARWSHDGQKLVFTRNGNILTINADGSNEQLVLDDSQNLFDPSWSPDDSKIIYERNPDQGGDEIYIINADGSGQPTNISNSFSSNEGTPLWSPVQ